MKGGDHCLRQHIFAGAGEMRQHCRRLDWSATLLGPVEVWPASLRCAAQQVLAQPFPSALYWGAEQVMIYNDGLRGLLGPHHPAGLGRPARDEPGGCGIQAPIAARVLAGESLLVEDQPHISYRSGEPVNAWFTTSYAPLPDGVGGWAGVLVTAYETTARVRSSAALRVTTDREAHALGLADTLRGITDVPTIQRRAEELLEKRLVVDRARYTGPDTKHWADSARGALPSVVERVAGFFELEGFPTLAVAVPHGIDVVEEDVARSARLSRAERGALQSRQVGAFVIVPLMRGGRLRARMIVTTQRARRWAPEEIALIRETAERTWSAVESARAGAALRASEARQSFLVQLGDALRSLDDPRQIEEEAIAHIVRRLGVDGVYYLEADAQRQNVGVRYADAAGRALRSLGVHPLAPWAGLAAALRTSEPLVIPDAGAETLMHASLAELLGRAGVQAALAVPILERGNLLAALCVAQREPRRWGEDEVALLVEATERAWARIERAHAERALRVSEQKYRTLFGSIDEGVAMLEREVGNGGQTSGYRLLEQNPALARLLGAPDGSAERAGGGLGLDHDQLDQVMHTGSSARFERASPAPGRWLEVHVSRVGGPGSRNLVAVYNDITEHKRLAQVLRESEARQRFLLGLADRLRLLAAPLEIEAEAVRLLGEHLGVDRAYFAFLREGQGRALIGRDYARPPLPSVAGEVRLGDFPQALRVAEAARTFVIEDVENEASLSLEERRHFRDQLSLGALTVAPIVQNASVIGALTVGSAAARRWTAGEIALVAEAGTRTWAALEHRRAEASLRVSEARFRTFVDNVRDYAIFLVDPAGRITEWTAGAERVTGYPAAEVLGRSAALLYSAEDLAHEEPLRELREAEAVGRAEREAWRVRKDGRRFWVNEIATAVRDDDGGLVGFTIISRDLSEPRRSREQREGLLAAATAAHEEAQRANLAKDEFLGTLGHELRTPLAAILLWGAALRSGAVAEGDIGRAVDAILQSAETQSRLVDDLLDLSRLSAGKLRLTPAPADVAAIARAACDMVEPTARSKQVALALELDEDLGRGVLDSARLQQVLWNLLSNAIKFTPSGGQVTLRGRTSNGTLEIEVADNGEGIAPEFLPHVFERFRQADMGRTRQHTGLGIGLALCRHLVELQGGTIVGRSDGLGRGAVFSVRLPWSEVGEQAGDAASAAPLGGPERLRGLVVLLVEDDANTRDVMAWTLARAGAEVVAVGCGAEALARLDASAEAGESSHLDLIVSDLGLPEMTGCELIERAAQLRRARGQGPLPACAVSAHVRDADRQRAIDSGFDLYLAKPVTPDQLIEAVEDLRDVARTPRSRAGSATSGRAGW